jgi:hypothetical protein
MSADVIARPTREVASRDWHLNDDFPIYTRTAAPAGWTDSVAVLELSASLARRWNAVHESAHTVLALAYGVPVISVEIIADVLGSDPGPIGSLTHGPFSIPYLRHWVILAAGERAADRWLREGGLWTPERGWATERGAAGDRIAIADRIRDRWDETLTFGITHDVTDYETLTATADAALAHIWPQVLTLAAALDHAGFLTGEQAAQITGFTPATVDGAR